MTLSWNRKSLFEHKGLHIQKQSSSSDWPWSDKSYIVVIKDLQHQACIDQSRKGNNHTVIANSKTAPDLESLESLFSGLTWWSGWKVGKTHFLGQNWTPPPLPPQIVQNPHLANHWSYKAGWPLKMTARLDLIWVFSDMHTPQTMGSALKIQYFVFWCLIMMKLYDFLYIVNHWSNKVSWTLKMNAR